MPDGRFIGSAYIVVYPNTDAFAGLDAAIKKYTDATKPTVNVRPKLDKTAAAAVKAETEAALKNVSLGVSLDPAAFRAALAAMASQAATLHASLQNMRASVNSTAAEAKIAALQVQAASLARALAKAPANADLGPLEAKLLGIRAATDAITESEATLKAATDDTKGSFLALAATAPGWTGAIVRAVNTSLHGILLFNGAIGDLYTAVRGGDKVLPTFANHLLNLASTAHLVIEAGVEFVAVWAPALIALAAYAAAATPTVINLYKQLQNMNTAATGTGKSFQSLALSGQSVVRAVQPTVLEAFGIALFAIQNHAGDLANVMHTLGQGIDQFAAKAAIAFDSTAGSKFFETGAKDALALMDSFQQLGSIIGTLLKVVPGYAEILLNFGNTLLTVAADAVKVAEPVLQIGVALHGALFYGGLAGTAIAFGLSKIIPVVTSVVEGIASIAVKAGLAEPVVAALGNVLISLDALGGPIVLGGIALLTGAIVGVVMYLKAASNAAADFSKTIESTLSKTAVTALPATLANDLAQANAKVAGSTQALAQAQKEQAAAGTQIVVAGKTAIPVHLAEAQAVMSAQKAADAYRGTQEQLSQQSQNLNRNLGAIAAQFGTSIPGALSLADAAQVTSNQLLAKGAGNWAVISTMISGYIAQLRVIVPGTGSLNQALNALNVTQSQQVADAQKLAQAYQSWIGIVTGGDSAFTTFEQGQSTLASALNSATGKTVAFTDKLGNLTVKGTAAGASMTGLSDASLNARQAFDSQVSAAATLYGNLQTLSVVSGSTAASQQQLYQAGKDMVAQLLPMAQGSKEATSEVFALAQIVGYAGTNSFPALSKWLGTTKGAEADLNAQQAALTTSSANLTQAAKDLSAAMANEVAAGEAAAIAQGTHLNQLQQQLVTSFENANGSITAQGITLAGQYYEALIKSGTGATQAEQDVDAFLTKLGATSGVVDQVNAALAKLPKQVNIGINVQVTEAISNQIQAGGATNAVRNALAAGGFDSGGIVHAASGMTVRGHGPSGKDSQLVMAAPGELIIPTSHAPKFRDMARKASIPGFADGGVPAPVFSRVRAPYSYAQGAQPVAVTVPVAVGAGQGSTMHQAQQTNELLGQILVLLKQQPYAYAQAVNQANASGVRRGYFATAG